MAVPRISSTPPVMMPQSTRMRRREARLRSRWKKAPVTIANTAVAAAAGTGSAKPPKSSTSGTSGSSSSKRASQPALHACRLSKPLPARVTGDCRSPQPAMSAISMAPGSSPARNMSFRLTWPMIEYMTSGRQGGSRTPSDPAPAISPSAPRSSCFAASSNGMTSPPSARMVTPEPPVKAVKNAQARTVTIAGPPRRCPVQAINTVTTRRAARVPAST